MGATDRTALDRLVRDFGAEVRVNYETQSTRLSDNQTAECVTTRGKFAATSAMAG
jgi:hypothetical protein